MKWLVGLLIGINAYFGFKNLLNVCNILNDSKYSQGATVVFAILFLGMAAGGFWTAFVKGTDKLALAISLGPWIAALGIALFSMLTGDYK